MSLFNTLSTGASGLGSASMALGVIGDNIANIGTTGFKGATAQFADNFTQNVAGLSSFGQLGSGSRLGDVAIDYGQGSLAASNSSLDVAIVGQGFFQVADATGSPYYSRDGSFHLDPDSYLVNSGGLRLQGFQALNGVIASTVGDIQVDPAGLSQQETANIDLTANLDPSALADDALALLKLATPFDGTVAAPTLATVDAASDWATSVTVFDSLGVAHDVTLFFEKAALPAPAGTWNVTAAVDGGEVDTNGDGAADGVPGSAFEIGTTTLTFDTNGDLLTNTGMTAPGGWTFPGASNFAPTFNFGLDAAGVPTPGRMTQASNASYLTAVAQDGYATGDLDSLVVDPDGTIRALYSNGEDQALGQLVLATFASNSGLERLGSNLYAASLASGDAALDAAGAGGRGTTSGFALESSNVDLEDQFVSMIQSQRSYQANTGVIQAANEALQGLIQLV